MLVTGVFTLFQQIAGTWSYVFQKGHPKDAKLKVIHSSRFLGAFSKFFCASAFIPNTKNLAIQS